MKDTSRPHPNSSSRPAPYRKRKPFGNPSPARGTRRPCDASKPQPPGQTKLISLPDRAQNSRRDEAQTSNSSAGDERRKTARNRAISHTRRYSSTEGPARELSTCTTRGALSIHADVPGPSLRLPLTSAPPTTNTFGDQNKAESPPLGAATAFLRSIQLPDKPSSAPAHQSSFSLSNPPPLRLPSLSTGNTDKIARTNDNGCQVSLIYKGYPFTYDLSALPDDPKSTIALLNITKSDPGAYFLVGAHYRRTGRSWAASAVIRSLLDNLDMPSDVEKGNGDVAPPPPSATSTVTLVSPGSPCLQPVDCTRPVVKSAAMRPAMLLLAACELDISREHPDNPKSASHAYTAHELFRAVYGTVNDAIVAGSVRPEPKNALGLDFASNRSGSQSDPNRRPLANSAQPPREAGSTARVKVLEKELGTARTAHKKLQEKFTVSSDRLRRAEDKVYTLESRSREVFMQLDATRDENWELRRRLSECEQRERELAQYAPNDNRVWGRIKGLFLDNLGGGMRGA